MDLAGYDLSEVYPEYQNKNDSMKEEMQEGADYTNALLYSYRKRNMQDHQFMLKATKDDHTVFIEKAAGLEIYESRDINSLIYQVDDSNIREVLATALRDGVDKVFVSDNSKNVITEKDNQLNYYMYKRFKKNYGIVSYDIRDFECSIENGYPKKI